MTKGASVSLAVDYGNIPGRPILKDRLAFDGTPEGFDRALEALRVAFHEKASDPLRPCGHPGPWHHPSVTNHQVRRSDGAGPYWLTEGTVN